MTDPRCGTYAGYVAHGKKYEKKCEPCMVARREYERANTKPRTLPPTIRAKCGTSAGYKAHEMYGEKSCDPCRLAINEVVRLRNQSIKKLRAERSRTYRATNLEHVRKVELEYRKRFPEKRRAKDMMRLARKKGASELELFTTQDVLDLYGTNCHICNQQIDLALPRHAKDNKWGLHIDHVTALANGGAHTLENVRPAHGFCNLSKGAKELTGASA